MKIATFRLIGDPFQGLAMPVELCIRARGNALCSAFVNFLSLTFMHQRSRLPHKHKRLHKILWRRISSFINPWHFIREPRGSGRTRGPVLLFIPSLKAWRSKNSRWSYSRASNFSVVKIRIFSRIIEHDWRRHYLWPASNFPDFVQ